MVSNTHKLEGKVAIITGASRGIGAAAAKRFAQEGLVSYLLPVMRKHWLLWQRKSSQTVEKLSPRQPMSAMLATLSACFSAR
jgi:NADP-dependent 3-hydroxy acid dehydrogenase YdfG